MYVSVLLFSPKLKLLNWMIMYDILFPSPNMISVGIKELLMNDDKNYKVRINIIEEVIKNNVLIKDIKLF